MSSEDKSVNSSEHGPSPPQSSAEATPSGSPAPADRRARGRHRRDSVNSAPKSRPTCKSRSRGKAQADDEDSMDATMPPETGVMELEVDEEEEEEEDFPQSLSPLFRRSVSEDSAGSSASTAGKAKTRVKLCAFCYCGERSVLGQGELKLFGPTPGYVPLHIRNRRGSSEKDDDYHDEDDDFNDDHDNGRSPGQRGRGLKNSGEATPSGLIGPVPNLHSGLTSQSGDSLRTGDVTPPPPGRLPSGSASPRWSAPIGPAGSWNVSSYRRGSRKKK